MATKTTAKRAKAPSKKASGRSTLDNVAELVRSAGSDGIEVKKLAARAGVTTATVQRALQKLEQDGKIRRDGAGMVFPKGRTGRRSTEVVERDQQILDAITSAGTEGLTLEATAEAADTTKRLAYESVWRLRKEGKITREGSTRAARWVAT